MLEYLKEQQKDLYNEIFKDNVYHVSPEDLKGKVVFDIGANRGFFALLANEYGAKEIICVEHQIHMCNGLLKENTKHLPNVKIINKAVTDKSNNIVRLSNFEDWTASLYSNVDKGLGQEVETITLADLVKNYPDEKDMYLKMDIEGAEYDIIMNIEEDVIRKFGKIGIEIHGRMHPKYVGTEILEKKLVELGFYMDNVKEICNIYTNAEGNKTYIPIGQRNSSFTRLPKKKNFVLIAPYAQKLRNGEINSKNYPYWKELIELIGKDNIIQIGVKGEEQLVPDFRQNLSLTEIEKLLKDCAYWISVDSFLQHFADYTKKKGVVIFGPSDPMIFGYPNNLNILKNRGYLRVKQFSIWEEEKFDANRFLKANEVYEIIKDNFNLS